MARTSGGHSVVWPEPDQPAETVHDRSDDPIGSECAPHFFA